MRLRSIIIIAFVSTNIAQAQSRIGIGTATPSERLDVIGNIKSDTTKASKFKMTTNAGIGKVLTTDALGNGVWQIPSGLSGGGTTNFLPKFTNITSLGNSVISEVSGNIGIGITPAYKLDVNGSVNIGATGSMFINGNMALGQSYANTKIVLYDSGSIHQFYGFGVNSGAMRYQIPDTNDAHIFYAGTSSTTSSQLMKIDGRGNARITRYMYYGFAPSILHQLVLSVDDAYKPLSSTWTISSDARLKTVTGNYTKGLKENLQLNTIRYHYNKDNPRNLPTDKEGIGFVAQELQHIFPEAVKEDKDGYLSIDIHPVLMSQINAIKELNETNVLQEQQLENIEQIRRQQKQEIEDLRKTQQSILQQLAQLKK